VQHEKIGKKKHYAMWYLALRLDKQIFYTTLLLILGLKRFGIMVFSNFVLHTNFKDLFPKNRKLRDVYIFKKLISPFFVEFFYLFGAKNNDQTTNCIKGVTPYCKLKLRRIIYFGPPYAKWI